MAGQVFAFILRQISNHTDITKINSRFEWCKLICIVKIQLSTYLLLRCEEWSTHIFIPEREEEPGEHMQATKSCFLDLTKILE
jgi:hypothetical protein